MADWFYRLACLLGRPPLWLASRPIELHVDRVPLTGPLILAPNHTSPFDVPCLMRSCPRPIDFLSIVEMQRKPLIGPLYTAMNCVFVDRDRRDIKAARALRERLRVGRLLSIFPEGAIRKPEQSITRGGPFKPGIVRLAMQSGVPILPCVMINTAGHAKPLNWFPFQRWAYGINFGEPMMMSDEATGIVQLRGAYQSLHQELEVHMPK